MRRRRRISVYKSATEADEESTGGKDGDLKGCSTVGTVSGVKELIGGTDGVGTTNRVAAAGCVNVRGGTATTTGAVGD